MPESRTSVVVPPACGVSKYQIVHPRTKECFDGGSEVKRYRLRCEGTDTCCGGSSCGIVTRILSLNRGARRDDGKYPLVYASNLCRVVIVEGHSLNTVVPLSPSTGTLCDGDGL